MKEEFYIIPEQEHNKLVTLAYKHRGYSQEEAEDAAKFCSFASAHGVRTHNAIKALHLDELFGSCLLYTSPSPRDRTRSRMPSSA